MMKRTNESGRSMVEMLGVLAIIGVLSVGGIAGYTMAMNRYRANEVIDMANKYAVVVFSAYETNLALNRGTPNGFAIPSFASTGLVPGGGSSVSGTTFTDTKLCSAISDAGACTAITVTNGTHVTTSAVGVQMTLTFDNADVCRAAASSLGVTCDSSTVTFVSKQS